MNVTLTPELEKFITETIERGKFSSVEEVIREGLRLLKEHEEAEQNGTSGRGKEAPGQQESVFDRRTPEERAKAWEEWVKSHENIPGPKFLDDSRESIYGEREDSQL